MAKPTFQSFEVSEYSDPELDSSQAYGVIRQIFSEMRKVPRFSVWADWTGSMLKIHHNSYEAFLPERIQEVQAESKIVMDEAVKTLKKEFKARTGKTLKLSENKEMADYSMEKVSLNMRFMFKSWRFYSISF